MKQELLRRGMGSDHRPAVYLNSPKYIECTLKLEFKGAGFMTFSEPSYNAAWLIDVDPSTPVMSHKERYGGNSFAYLDYDGFRDGPFQTNSGWCIERNSLISSHRKILESIGFSDLEIVQALSTYVVALIKRSYAAKYFSIYPQDKSIIDQSVQLSIDPKPDHVYRLWFYFVPSDEFVDLPVPALDPIERDGFHVIEEGFLTDLEIPNDRISSFEEGRILRGM